MTQYLQGSETSVQTWNVHGLAVKAAYQLGLHSTQALDRYATLEREMRIRVWYACVMLDRYEVSLAFLVLLHLIRSLNRTLSMTLGRPPLIPETHIRVDIPSKIPAPPFLSPGRTMGTSISDASIEFYNVNM